MTSESEVNFKKSLRKYRLRQNNLVSTESFRMITEKNENGFVEEEIKKEVFNPNEDVQTEVKHWKRVNKNRSNNLPLRTSTCTVTTTNTPSGQIEVYASQSSMTPKSSKKTYESKQNSEIEKVADIKITKQSSNNYYGNLFQEYLEDNSYSYKNNNKSDAKIVSSNKNKTFALDGEKKQSAIGSPDNKSSIGEPSPPMEADGGKISRESKKKIQQSYSKRSNNHNYDNSGVKSVKSYVSKVNERSNQFKNDEKYQRKALKIPEKKSFASSVVKCDSDSNVKTFCNMPVDKSAELALAVIAIDFGTTYSGYAFSFSSDKKIIPMNRWDDVNTSACFNKVPSTLLLKPNLDFHSFGHTARAFYNELSFEQAREWLYFENFKMIIHSDTNLNRDSVISAANGKSILVMTVLSKSLNYLHRQATKQISSHVGQPVKSSSLKWVLTVPAIWRPSAKQIMREAALLAGIVEKKDSKSNLFIALEPEAAALYCRSLKIAETVTRYNGENGPDPVTKIEEIVTGSRYIIVDCGGGTVDITIHELGKNKVLKELYKASGGPFGSNTIDKAFEILLNNIFGYSFIEEFKNEMPSGYVDLMGSFESRKKMANLKKIYPLNIPLPFSFIEFYRQKYNSDVGVAIKNYGDPKVTWSALGMIRIEVGIMKVLFYAAIKGIKCLIKNALENVRNVDLLFLVGGFSESQILQQTIREEFEERLKIIIPIGAERAVLHGAVLYGLKQPSVLVARKSTLTYGVGVVKKFDFTRHPENKLIWRDGFAWCLDVFDKFVSVNEEVSPHQYVARRYRPAARNQNFVVLHIFCSEFSDVEFVTDERVQHCGTLTLQLNDSTVVQMGENVNVNCEIETKMMLGETEITAVATDINSGKSVNAEIDFLDNKNPSYCINL